MSALFSRRHRGVLLGFSLAALLAMVLTSSDLANIVGGNAAVAVDPMATPLRIQTLEANMKQIDIELRKARAAEDALQLELNGKVEEVRVLKAAAAVPPTPAPVAPKPDVDERARTLEAELKQAQQATEKLRAELAEKAKAVAELRAAAAVAPPPPVTTGADAAIRAGLRQFPEPKPVRVKPLARSDDGASHMDCVGSSIGDRACTISNVCYNTMADNPSSRHTLFELYTGSDMPLHPDAGKPGTEERLNGACVPMNDDAGSWQCFNDRTIWAGSLGDGPLVWRPHVFHGKVPESRVQAWFDEPLIIFNRHWPSNVAHAISDDYFAMFTMQRDWLGWDDIAQANVLRKLPPPPGEVASETEEQVDEDGKPLVKKRSFDEDAILEPPAGISVTANLIYLDRMSYYDYSARILPMLYPNVRHFTRSKLEKDMKNADKPLVCFRTAIAGAPGRSMHNNGAYVYFHSRTWAQNLVGADAALRIIKNHVDFVEYFLAAVQLPSKSAATRMIAKTSGNGGEKFSGVLLGDGSGKGTVLIVNRKTKRALRNIEAVEKEARAVSGGRRVVTVDWSDLSTRQQVAAALNADIVVAVHGAGAINSIFLRPGAAWVDLLPPRATNFAPTFMALAQRLSVAWYTLPLTEIPDAASGVVPADRDAHNQPAFDVDVTAVKAFIALALGTEAR